MAALRVRQQILPQAKKVVLALALLTLLSVGLVSLMACAGRLWWLLDLFSHFRVQYLSLLANSAIRDRMLTDVAEWARATPNAIVVGDLNATPWSYAFRELLEESSLVNSQLGFGVQSTWPGALWPFAIPIDHGLHGRGLTTHNRSVGPFLGSDHRPLQLRIGVTLDARDPPG